MNSSASDKCRRPYPIVQLTSSGDMGGTERMVLELASRLDRKIFNPIVLCLVGDETLIEVCRRHRIEAEHLRCRHPLSWKAWARYMEILRTRHVPLAHLYGLRANLPGRYLSRRAGVKWVIAGIRSTDPWRRWYHVWLDRWTSHWVDMFISNSHAGRDRALRRERFRADKIEVIPSGVEMPPASDFACTALRRKFGVADDAQPVVAIVANLGPEKRHRDLIDAVKLLALRFPKMAVLCAGRDEMDGANQRYAIECGMGERFRWLGRVDHVAEIFAAADFAVLPSSHEGMPASVLEAMAMGRTVIASEVGGIPEIIRNGENGVLIPACQPPALAEAIGRLATDSALRKRLEDGARRAIEHDFSMERMVERIQQAYLHLIEANVASEKKVQWGKG